MKFETILTSALFLAFTQADPGGYGYQKGLCSVSSFSGPLSNKFAGASGKGHVGYGAKGLAYGKGTKGKGIKGKGTKGKGKGHVGGYVAGYGGMGYIDEALLGDADEAALALEKRGNKVSYDI